MPDALVGLFGALAVVAVCVAAFFVWYWIKETGILILLLNIGVAILGIAAIISWPGSIFSWLIGGTFTFVGGYNSIDGIKGLWNYGTVDYQVRLDAAAAIRRDLETEQPD